MFTFIFTIALDLLIALAMMTGLWLYFNKEDEKVMEMNKVVGEIFNDAFKLAKDFNVLRVAISEITQPLLISKVIDIESKSLAKAVEAEKKSHKTSY